MEPGTHLLSYGVFELFWRAVNSGIISIRVFFMLALFYDYFWMILYFVIAILIGHFVHWIVFHVLKRIIDSTPINLDKYLVKYLKKTPFV